MLSFTKFRLAGKNLSLLFLAFLSFQLTTFAQWDQLMDIPTARYFLSSCTIDGKIYVIGGTESTSASGPSVGTMEVYDPIQDSWDTTKAPMPTSRVELGACAVNGKIYAIGGANTHASIPFGMVEEYNPLTNTWDTNKDSMPTPRKGAAYGVIDNKIYVAGGSEVSGWTASNKLEIYDPVTDTWESINAAMQIPIYGNQGAVINDKFYTIGGLLGSPPWTGQKIVQMYDPITNTWSRVADLKKGRAGSTANSVAGKIYVIGGDTQPPIVIEVEEYDSNLDTFTVIDSAPFAKICHTASLFENKIYLFGGSTTTIFPTATPTSAVWSFAPPPAAPILISPTDSVNVPEAEFIWTSSYPEIEHYWFELDTTDQFTTSFVDSLITDTTYLYSNLENHKDYWWRVKASNSLGWGDFSEVRTFVVDIPSSVEGDNQLPIVFGLEQNYPNPFNPSTKIKYTIPQSSNVVIKVFDILGNEIETLVNEEKLAGTYELNWYAENLPSGVYFYKLQAGSFIETKKMLLLK